MLRVCVIGAGNIAKTIHLPIYQKTPEVEIVGLSDMNAEALNRVADEYGIPHRFADYQEMLDQLRPDLVSVCTPNKFHYEQTLAALRCGAHVFCEKPPALSFSQLREMHETAVAMNRKLAFNFHHRLRKETAELRAWVGTQASESIYFAEVQALRRRGIPGWGNFTNRDLQGGGALIDIGVHMLDLFLFIMDFPKPLYVSATSSNRIGRMGGVGDMGEWKGEQFTVEDSLFGQIVFEHGLTVQLQTAFTHNFSEKSKMGIHLFGVSESATLQPFAIYDAQGKKMENAVDSFSGLSVLPNFLASLLDPNVLCVAESASVLMTQKLLDALYHSAQTLEPVRLEE